MSYPYYGGYAGSPYGGGAFGGYSAIPEGPFQQFGTAIAGIGPEFQQGQQFRQQQEERRSKAVLDRYQILFTMYKNNPSALAQLLPQLEKDLQNSGDPNYKNFQLPRKQVTQQPNIMGPAGAPPGGAPSGAFGTPGTPVTPTPEQTIPALPPLGGPYGGTWNLPGAPAATVPPGMEHRYVPPTTTPTAAAPAPATGDMAQAVPPTVPPAATGTTPTLPPGTTPAAYQPPTRSDQIMMPATAAADTPLSDWLSPGMMDQLVSQYGYNRDRIGQLTLADVPSVPGLSDAINNITALAGLNAPPTATQGQAPSGPPPVAGLVPAQNIPTTPPSGAPTAGQQPGGPPEIVRPIMPTYRTTPFTGPIRTKGDLARKMNYSDEFAGQFDSVPITNYQKGGRIDIDTAQKEINSAANEAIRTNTSIDREAREAGTAADTAREKNRKSLIEEAVGMKKRQDRGEKIDWGAFGQKVAKAGLTLDQVMPDAERQYNKDILGTPVMVKVGNQWYPMLPAAYVNHATTVAHNKVTEANAAARLEILRARAAREQKTPNPTIVVNGQTYTYPQLLAARSLGIVTDPDIQKDHPDYVPPPDKDPITAVDKEALGQAFKIIGDTSLDVPTRQAAVDRINRINKKYGIDPIPDVPQPEVDTTPPKSNWWDPQPPAPAKPTPAKPAPATKPTKGPGTGKTRTWAQVLIIARQRGVTPAAALKNARDNNYTVIGVPPGY